MEKTAPDSKNEKLFLPIETYVQQRKEEFKDIPSERKEVLIEIADYIKENEEKDKSTYLTFICTHNSRRSHMSQIWAQTAASYYRIDNVYCYSGGTEATAFNPRAVKAMQKAGFKIEKTNNEANPIYKVTFSKGMEPIKAFSKKYEDEFNPVKDFAAIMTCSEADEACPIVFGASARISIPYEDPKVADGTSEEEAKYDERCQQIACEMFYIFSQVNKNEI